MSGNDAIAREAQRRRWLRPDWQRWMREDADRFAPPAVEARGSRSDHADDAEFAAELNRLRAQQGELRRMLAGVQFELALRRLRRKYSPEQPREPAGSSIGGRWTVAPGAGVGAQATRNDTRVISDASPESSFEPGARYAANEDRPPGIGHNNGPILQDPPDVPQQRPPTEQAKNNFIKEAARWIATAIRAGRSFSPFVAAYEAMSWLDTDRPLIESYQDPPRSLEELQQAVSNKSAAGYNDHHIVEKAAARDANYPEEIIQAPDNKARIPTLKHWEITGWFQRANPRFKDPVTGEAISPRDYLKDKEWAERRRVGLEALIEFEVLKP
jgi:hypothetical protein